MGLAFITGGTSGIGYAFANYFAGMGYDLILTGKRDDNLTATSEDFRNRYKTSVELVFADFRNDTDTERVEKCIKDSRADVLINSAGYGSGKLFMESDQRDYEDLVKVHIIAPLRFMHAALPAMIGKKAGIIVYLSSLSAFMPVPRDPVYSSCKSFNNSFLESLHISLHGSGVKFQVLCPGFVHTNFHNRPDLSAKDMSRRSLLGWMEPGDVVRISVRNLHRKNKVVVVPGVMNKMALILYQILPRFVFYRIASGYFI